MAEKKSQVAKRHGKKYAEKHALIEKKLYLLDEALELLPQTSYVKFDATAEVHLNINSDTKHADQIVRSTIVLPHGTGKTKKIAAFVTEDKQKAAKAAGADIVGHTDLIAEIQKGNVDFEIAVALPAVMKDLAKVAKILGQKGLMPSPKSGTVSDDIEGVISEIKKGKIEFRTDKLGIIHSPFGKLSFGKEKLSENIRTLLRAIVDAKPSGIKGAYIAAITITTSMGPGITLNVSDAIKPVS